MRELIGEFQRRALALQKKALHFFGTNNADKEEKLNRSVINGVNNA